MGCCCFEKISNFNHDPCNPEVSMCLHAGYAAIAAVAVAVAWLSAKLFQAAGKKHPSKKISLLIVGAC